MGFYPPPVHLFFKTGGDNLLHFCTNFWEPIQAKCALTEISQVKLQKQYMPPPP